MTRWNEANTDDLGEVSPKMCVVLAPFKQRGDCPWKLETGGHYGGDCARGTWGFARLGRLSNAALKSSFSPHVTLLDHMNVSITTILEPWSEVEEIMHLWNSSRSNVSESQDLFVLPKNPANSNNIQTDKVRYLVVSYSKIHESPASFPMYKK